MVPQQVEDHGQHLTNAASHDRGDLSDLLEETRALLQGTQVLTGFLIILPFSQGFAKIDIYEQWVYLITFLCALSSLVLFSAPAAQHRLERPVRQRLRFKLSATRVVIAGLVTFSLALICATQLVVSEVIGTLSGTIVAVTVGFGIVIIWWVLPLMRRARDQIEA